MDTKELKLLPLGTSDFSVLRLRDQIYVDKTELIFEMARLPEKFFLARPRRFGKSLLISTFESLFKFGLRDFKDLAIEKLWKEKETFNVVRLDFSLLKDFDSSESFRDRFNAHIANKFSSYGFVFKPDINQEVSDQLAHWMEAQESNSLVLLIDEYDAPLTSCLNSKELFEDIRRILSGFYSVLKSNDRVLRFLFITGITKFNKINIFSELNNLTDLTLSPRFGTLLGYTREEIQQYFSGYLERSSCCLSLSEEELLNELIVHYDGFCFERTAKQKVFSPWSLLKFFSEPESGFLDYWFESGGKPAVLLEYLKSHSLRNPEEYGRIKTISLSSISGASDVETLSDLGLLFQTGYLTIKAVQDGETVYLDYPNLEVSRAMAQLYVELMLNGRVAGQVGAGSIVKVLSEESAESVFHILNRLFLSIDYQRYPVRDEASLRAFIQVYLAGDGLKPKIEHHNAYGRSDLEVAVSDRYWTFELKIVREGERSQNKLEEGLEQMIRKHYGEQARQRIVKQVVLVYSIKERQFVKWQELKN